MAICKAFRILVPTLTDVNPKSETSSEFSYRDLNWSGSLSLRQVRHILSMSVTIVTVASAMFSQNRIFSAVGMLLELIVKSSLHFGQNRTPPEPCYERNLSQLQLGRRQSDSCELITSLGRLVVKININRTVWYFIQQNKTMLFNPKALLAPDRYFFCEVHFVNYKTVQR